MTGITFAQVAATADQLVANGTRVTIEAVRSQLGTGSPNTIHKHLKIWTAGVQTPAAQTLTISQSLTAALHNELTKTAAEARAQLEVKLADCESTIDSLEKGSSVLEIERDSLLQKVGNLTTERDNITGKSAQQDTALAALEVRASSDHAAAESARIALAQERLSSAHLLSSAAANSAEIVRLIDALDIERNARIVAEKSAAVLTAEHQSAMRVAERTNEQLVEKSNELHSARMHAQSQQSEHAAALRDLQGAILDAQRAATVLMQQLQQAQSTAQAAGAAARQAEQEAAQLRGRLQAMVELTQDAHAI